jgi:hypothetical protein
MSAAIMVRYAQLPVAILCAGDSPHGTDAMEPCIAVQNKVSVYVAVRNLPGHEDVDIAEPANVHLKTAAPEKGS